MNLSRNIFSLLVIAIVLTGLSSCVKSSSTPDPVVNWEKYQGVTTSVGLLNSANTDGNFNIQGPASYYNTIGNVFDGKPPVQFSMNGIAGNGRYKFPVADKFYTFITDSKLILRSAASTPAQSLESSVDMNAMNAGFSEFIDIPYWQGECTSLSKDNYLLVPFRAVSNGVSVPTPSFEMIKIIPPVSKDAELKIYSTRTIQYNIYPGVVNVKRMQSFGNEFYVVMGNETYRIDTLGVMDKVADKELIIFQKGTELFAFSPNASSGKVEYLQSVDQGRTWLLLGEIPVDLLASLQYTTIADKIIGYTKGQFFLVELNGPNFLISELDNTGLSQADITSISMADANTVFITSHSNGFTSDCGGYYKPLEYFFTRKK